MKKPALLLILTLLTSTAIFAFSLPSYDGPEFKLIFPANCSDQACFDVQYSYPGEGRKVVSCTVKVEVQYSKTGGKDGKTETFEMKRDVGSSGSGWAYFDGKSALDTVPPLSAKITGQSCG